MDAYTSLYTTGGIPALVSTTITIIYFAVKFLSYVFNAGTRTTEGRERTLCHHPSTHHQSPTSGTESNHEIYKDISGYRCEEVDDGRGQRPRSTGTLLLPSGRQNIRISPDRATTGDQTMPPLRTDVERCGRRRGSDTGEHFGTGPQSSHINSATVFKECRRGEEVSHEQPQPAERNGRESRTSRPDEIRNDGVSRFSKANQARHPSTSAQEVSEIVIQTESCDTIYVTKDTLVAYTIAIVQNTQTLQFDQMQVALQTVQNHTSIETPLKAEQLMTVHFNLAILTDNIASNSVVDALASETGIPDPGPATFASEEQTICKTPHPNSRSNKRTRSTQPTTAVLPTYRAEPGPVRGIPVGYESDNSWDFSDAGEADCT